GWVPRLGLTSLCVVVCAAVLFSLAVLRLLECDWVRRFEVGLCIGISFGSAGFSAATTEAPPRPSSRRGRIPRFACRPELVTLALCLRGKASPFWIMLLLVLGLHDHQTIQCCHNRPQTVRANHRVRNWPKRTRRRTQSMSLLGVKRTWVGALQMSAYDPKRTSAGS